MIHTANALQTTVKSKPTPTQTDLKPKVDNLNATLQEAVEVPDFQKTQQATLLSTV